jgi:diacylglycerol O-acyltransferase / wax synthase
MMKRIPLMDACFLYVERRNQLMHVAGMMLLTPPDNDVEKFVAKIKDVTRRFDIAQPPFNQKAVQHLGVWFWKKDDKFSIDNHVHHLVLPAPGHIRDLLTQVSELHGQRMDRAKPLWELYLISGLEDGRVALYVKIHHALYDGVAVMKLLNRATTDTPDADLIPLWAVRTKQRTKQAGAVTPNPYGAMIQAVKQIGPNTKSIGKVYREVFRSLRGRRTNPDYVSPFLAPKTIFSQRISEERRFAAQSWSLDRIRNVGKQYDATINDVVLAMCGAALRRYLLDMEALPVKPLVAMVPVSLRKDDSEGGTQVALVLANLGTHQADPRERLGIIARSMNDSKQRFARMEQREILGYLGVVMGMHLSNVALGVNPNWQAFNVIVSNVPGPKEVRYWFGARVEGIYPASIPIDGVALNVTLNTYAGNLEFGLAGCSRTLPHMQNLLQYLEEGLAELE